MNDENKLHKYVYWLGESIPEQMQKEAEFYLLQNCDDVDVPYIICPSNPFTWKKSIEIIQKIGYPKNKLATERIMYLFQDVNWSFVDTALEVIFEIYKHEPKSVIGALENAARLANRYDDTDWLFGLSEVKEHLNITKNDFHESETANILFKGGYWEYFDEIR